MALSLMVTGHRILVPQGHTESKWPEHNESVRTFQEHLKKRIVVACESMMNFAKGELVSFITGMAIGADQLFAKAVLEIKSDPKYRGAAIQLVCACPFLGQESKWPESSKREYKRILQQANEVVYICDPGYAAWKMQKRNEWMVDHSQNVLAVWDGATSGGTWNCIQYAKQKKRNIFQMNPYTTLTKLLEKEN